MHFTNGFGIEALRKLHCSHRITKHKQVMVELIVHADVLPEDRVHSYVVVKIDWFCELNMTTMRMVIMMIIMMKMVMIINNNNNNNNNKISWATREVN